MEHLIELIKKKGLVLNRSEISMATFDEIIKQIDKKTPLVSHFFVFCNKEYLKDIKGMLLNTGYSNYGTMDAYVHALNYLRSLSFSRGAYSFHVLVQNDVDGIVIVPEHAKSESRMAKKGVLLTKKC